MGQVIELRPGVGPITKEEWTNFWQARLSLTKRISRRKRQLEILELAETEWAQWRNDLCARLAAGARIEDEGRIA